MNCVLSFFNGFVMVLFVKIWSLVVCMLVIDNRMNVRFSIEVVEVREDIVRLFF